MSKPKTPTVWVIADTHFGHRMLVERGFRPDDFEMDIIRALTDAVYPGDLVIHLGDFCIGQDEHWLTMYEMATVGATRILVRGNHDGKSNAWYRARGFHFVCERFEDTYYGQSVVFSHRPVELPMAKRDPLLNVHGHTHGNDHRDSEGVERTARHLEVACETLGYGPVRLEHLLNGKLK